MDNYHEAMRKEGRVFIAAGNWYEVRKSIFAKDKTDLKDWDALANAEQALMKAVKEFKE